ncbi:MAG TPA: DUF1992 domain-containing protein [Ktedonobacterales bacterium]
MNPQRAQPDEPGDVEQGQSTKPKRLSWSDYIEEQIRSAQERGEFRNLEGHGKPLQLDENPWAGERAMAYRLLKANNVAPPEIEAGRAVDDDLARAESALATLRQRRDDLLGRRAAFPSERRAYEILRSKTEMRYAEALRAANSKILSLNIIAPAALHRRVIDVEARLRAFHEEFPAATVAEGGA